MADKIIKSTKGLKRCPYGDNLTMCEACDNKCNNHSKCPDCDYMREVNRMKEERRRVTDG